MDPVETYQGREPASQWQETRTHVDKKKGLNGRDGSGTRSFITVTASHHCDRGRAAVRPQCSNRTKCVREAK